MSANGDCELEDQGFGQGLTRVQVRFGPSLSCSLWLLLVVKLEKIFVRFYTFLSFFLIQEKNTFPNNPFYNSFPLQVCTNYYMSTTIV